MEKTMRGRVGRAVAAVALASALASALACGDDGLSVGTTIGMELSGMRDLDPVTEGTYEAWLVDDDGSWISVGRFLLPREGHVVLENPLLRPRGIRVTIEPPGDDDLQPSDMVILGGDFDGSVAELTIEGFVTAGPPLEEAIGSHGLFTPANNTWMGYPSIEDAGIWVFNLHAIGDPMQRRGLDLTSEFFLKVTPLKEAWVYEGWVVQDYGSDQECWISYGKMVPGIGNRLNRQDNTGFGPFSGYRDYVANPIAIEHNFPGDDWVENPLDLPVPCGLEIPLDLNGNAARGIESRWTHVITIEPAADGLVESPEVDPAAPLLARPFLIRPYVNPIGTGLADHARVILFNPDGVPRGTAQLWGY